MPNFLMKWIKALLILSVFLLIVANFDSPAIGDSYPLESVSTKENGQTSRIYRAEGKTVPEVAKELSELRQPDEISKEDAEHMFLIYSDELYHLQRDQAKPSDTLIEVDSKEYVRENYDSSFLQGYILASVLDDLFDGHKKARPAAIAAIRARTSTSRQAVTTYRPRQRKRRRRRSRRKARAALQSAVTAKRTVAPKSARTAICSKSRIRRLAEARVKLFARPTAARPFPQRNRRCFPSQKASRRRARKQEAQAELRNADKSKVKTNPLIRRVF